MTLYTYRELREALDSAAQVRMGIDIAGSNTKTSWNYSELGDLQAILEYLPVKYPVDQEGDRVRSDAWSKVVEHPIFSNELWGNTPILEAVLDKLDELHRGPLPTEYGSIIKNAKVTPPYTSKREHDYMQLTNIGWFGVDKDNGVIQEAQPEHITSWEPIDSE